MYTYEDAKNIKRQCQQVVFDAINKYKESGTEATLNFIIEKLKPYIYVISELTAYSYKKTLTTDAIELAEDVTSITMVKLWKHLGDFNNQYPESIFSWIGTTVENHFRDIYKKGKHKEVLLFSSDDFDKHDNHLLDKIYIKQQGSPDNVPNNPENMQISQDINKILMYVLGSLSEKEALIMRYKRIHGLDNASIAQEMNVSLSTVAHSVKSAEKNYLAALRQYEQKTGTKLYSLAIFELLGVLYYMSAQETTVPESVSAKFSQMLAEQVATEATKATGKEIVKSVVKKATDTVTKKVIIGVLTIAIVTGTIISILPRQDKDVPIDNPTEDLVEDSTDNNKTDDFDPKYLILTDELKSQLSVITEYYWKNVGTTTFESGGESLYADYTFLSTEHYMQLLRDLVVTENMLNREGTIEMSEKELSDFINHTLNFNYQTSYEPVQLEEYFTKTTNESFLITAGTPLGYDNEWIFTSVERGYIDGILTLNGYAIINNRHVYVTACAVIDTLSHLNGYKIDSIYFSDVKKYGTDIKYSLTDKDIENVTWLGKIFWDELAKKTGTIEITLDFYSTMISKMLATDNVLNKTILKDSQNQEYVLVSEQEIYDFALKTLNYEPEPGEINQCFSKNESGNYIVYATQYPFNTYRNYF